MAAGLLFVLALYLYLLSQGLAEGKFRLGKLNCHLITRLQLAYHYIQLLVADSIDQRLAVFCVIFNDQGQILFHHTCQSGGYLVILALIYCLVGHICIWSGNLRLVVYDRCGAHCHGVSSLSHCKLCHCSDITGL